MEAYLITDVGSSLYIADMVYKAVVVIERAEDLR
jgi:hypothetical protein